MSLADTIRGLGDPGILVVGDLVLDRYVFGSVDRISPEAPIGVLKVTGEEIRPGAAGSVARNLAVLGARVRLAGYLGPGEFGDDFVRLSEECGVDLSGVRRVNDRETFRKTRLIARRGAGGQQVLRVDREDTSAFSDADRAALEKIVTDGVGECDLVVLSDYAKGTLDPALLRSVIETACAAGVPVLVDPKPPDYARYAGATAITPNRPEAEAHAGFRVDSLDAARRAARMLRDDLGLAAAVITLDRDGIFLADDAGAEELFPTVPHEINDITGAGDMVISALAMAVAGGVGWRDAVRIANLAAGIEVSRLGVVPVTREEILESLHADVAEPAKCRPLPDLLEILAARRQRGERIVFTNGCFDVLHAGHIRLLAAARAEGDVLVVGLNSDDSIRGLKGEDRPVMNEKDRIEVLSALECVDHVLVFDGETPLREIEAIRPAVLVKGEDWADKGVIGRELVEEAGGRVVLVPLVPGLSSTEIIRRMKEERS